MEQVLLTHDGALLVGEHEADPMGSLGLALTLDRQCTLRSFFALVRRYPVLQSISGFLPKALAEERECAASGCLAPDMAVLVLGKTMELIGFPGEPRAELYLWLRGLDPEKAGVAPPSLATLMEADKEIRFVPLGLLLDIPLLLGGMKHMVLGNVDRSLTCVTRFTLFEVVDGLAWEFGFQGGQQQCSLGR